MGPLTWPRQDLQHVSCDLCEQTGMGQPWRVLLVRMAVLCRFLPWYPFVGRCQRETKRNQLHKNWVAQTRETRVSTQLSNFWTSSRGGETKQISRILVYLLSSDRCFPLAEACSALLSARPYSTKLEQLALLEMGKAWLKPDKLGESHHFKGADS